MGKIGRPTESPAINRLQMRLTSEEQKMLTECSEYYHLSKSEVVRKGIAELHKGIKK